MPLDDAFSVALLHLDGADASTTITDESGKTWTASGTAQIDTAQSKFGGASCLFASGDKIATADSADWQLDGGSDSNAWTIDFWYRANGDPGAGVVGYIQQYVDSNNYWTVHLDTNVLRFRCQSGGSTIINVGQTFDPATATWYHLAIVKDGTNGYMHFIDGTQVGSTTVDTSTLPNFAAGLDFGIYTPGAGVLVGWLDELRISKGIARWTANFTPPTAAYAPPGTGFFF